MMKTLTYYLASFLFLLHLVSCGEGEEPIPLDSMPVILEFSPQEGSAGTEVVIKGARFSNNISENIVEFNGTQAEIVEADSFEITAIVPDGATSGKVAVKVQEQKALSLDDFTVVLSPWRRVADFGGEIRVEGIAFSIGSKGYLGTGVGTESAHQTDFWEYDPATDQWKKLSAFAGYGIQSGVGFSVGNLGYVGLGTVGGSSTSAFYAYDPASDNWTRKADFAGDSRSHAVSFTIGEKAYVGTGASWHSRYNDFWEYNPATDSWKRLADFPGGERADAVAFSIGNKGYIGMGNGSGTRHKDLYEYDPATDTWTQKADLPAAVISYSTTLENRSSAVSFSIGQKGYVCTGNASGYTMKDLWEYDPVTDTWTRLEDFGGNSRSDAHGFVIGDKGYLGCGDGSLRFGDFWELSLQE